MMENTGVNLALYSGLTPDLFGGKDQNRLYCGFTNTLFYEASGH
ncbi:hypothetical protein FUAX_12760 [Fulvitalea axinellae]|uniref:Uncharacterized protein n=1 Tax=Fulvitalea axinellae TaxID=1182444 RepID=A0AAU9CQY6_9BACT|nr:hypothetical protein FUAX_12760 [Fulvitalea axinellae]